MKEIEISNEEELLALLKKALTEKKFDDVQLKFNNFSKLSIKISGDSQLFDGTLYYSLCKALCDFQLEIWKAYALFKTGYSDIRRLGNDEKEKLTIKFNVNKGSTEIIAVLTEFFNALSGLIKKVAKNMTSKEITICIIALALAISGPEIYKTYGENKEKEREQEIQKEVLQILKNSNEQLFDLTQKMQEPVNNGYIGIARAVPEAQRIEISGPGRTPISIGQEGLERLIRDTSNSQEASSRALEEFDLFVEVINAKNSDKDSDFIATVRLANDEKFNATINVEMMGEEGVKLVFDSCRLRTMIRLSGVVKRRGGSIERAVFTGVITP